MKTKILKNRGRLFWVVSAILLSALILYPSSTSRADGIAGCSASVSSDNSSGFNASHFDLTNVDVKNDNLALQTGNQAIDPDNIVVPFTQDVYVNFLYEGAGFTKTDFGWLLASDGKNGDKHEVYTNVNDNNNDGVLDVWDGQDRNDDGKVDARDNRVYLGKFASGTELVFYIDSSEHYRDSGWSGGLFFTKSAWNENQGRCPDGINRVVQLYADGDEGDTGCYDYGEPHTQGWLDRGARDRLRDVFNYEFNSPGEGDPPGFNTYSIKESNGTPATHVIVGAPNNTPDAWVLGFDDTLMDSSNRTNDYDYNDVVFMIERQTGGVAQLKSDQAILAHATDENAYFTAVTLEVYDKMPCLGDTTITYYVSINNGAHWVEVTDWDVVKGFTMDGDGNTTLGSDVSPWTPGFPQDTYRSIRVDFAGKGLSGRELIWKAELVSWDETCIPEIVDVLLTGTVANHANFSRSSPVVQGNVIYAGSYETPAATWTDKVPRGHLNATRLYDPANPNATAEQALWDAGEVLNSKKPSDRKIYFPNIKVITVTDEVIGTGKGDEKKFEGTLANQPLVATTLTITDTQETFHDEHADLLEGDLGGTGSINRFTGEFEIKFKEAPADGRPIKASYSYYSPSELAEFTTSNVSNDMLALDDTFIFPDGYVYDLDDDGDFDEADGDWLVKWVRGYKDGSSTKKEWVLGPIDHSVPALATPPGIPEWYFGSDTTDPERESFDTFWQGKKERDTVLYVGSRDGMLHAFDAGKFRWGDNPQTSVKEKRGYFLWEDPDPSDEDDTMVPNYGTGGELWAFIPANLIARLKHNLLMGDDQSYVDASPALADVFINNAWKTVLLSAQGNGGNTIFCLDVTDPHNPAFLWEFADPQLFRSRSSPAVTKIARIWIDGSSKWVAFFVSGKTYDPDLYPSIYMVDVADGSVVERIFLNVEKKGKGGVPSGQPAVVDSDSNGYVARIYIGTDKGYMYKVNIPDDPSQTNFTITHCVINKDFKDEDENEVAKDQKHHPIYGSPAIVVGNSNHIKIFFGTGDSPYYDEDINTADTQYHFFAYIDENDKDKCDDKKVHLDWFYELPEGNRIFASAFSAAGNIYFGTSTAETEDPCAALETGANAGSIYAFKMDGGEPVFQSKVGNVGVSPLVIDEHLYYRSSAGLNSIGGGKYNNRVITHGNAQATIMSWKECLSQNCN